MSVTRHRDEIVRLAKTNGWALRSEAVKRGLTRDKAGVYRDFSAFD